MRAAGQPEIPARAAVLVNLLGRDDRPAQTGLTRLDTDQAEGLDIDPRPARKERTLSRDRFEVHDVASSPLDLVGAAQLVTVSVRQRDRQWRRRDAFRLDDWETRNARAPELDPVDAHRAQFDVGVRANCVGDRFGADGDWRRETWRLERHRQRPGRDERVNACRLSRHRRLMPRDDLVNPQCTCRDHVEV